MSGLIVHYECGDSDEREGRDDRRGRGDRDSKRGRGDRDGGMAQEYWNKYARMSYKQFAQGYRHAEHGVTDEQIRDTFLYGDKNGDFELSFHEFQRLVALKEGPPDGDHAKMKWYWRHFASYKDRGMTQEEFYAGSQVENQGASWDEIMGYFHQLDHNGDSYLSRNEFFSMSEMDGHDGKDREEMNADDYWQKFSSGGHMSYEDFAEAYNHSTPGVSKDEIWAAWD